MRYRMNDIDYLNKYLKYKNKYLEFKKQQGGYFLNPSPGKKIVVKINNDLKFAYFVKNSVDGSAQFLIIGKKPENGGCCTNG
jgi:hypothetical protein